MCIANYRPVYGGQFTSDLPTGKRYAHSFGDLRLERRYLELLSSITLKGSSCISLLATNHAQLHAFYRFVANPKVTLSELFYRLTEIEVSLIAGKDLLVSIDTTVANLGLGKDCRKSWPETYGVVDDNKSTGFHFMPALVVDRHSGTSYGLGELLAFQRSKAPSSSKAEKAKRGVQRRQLPYEQRELSAWYTVSKSCSNKLQGAKSVTFIMDRGADSYELLSRIRAQTQRDFIVRLQHDRLGITINGGSKARISTLLEDTCISEHQLVEITSQHHYSKSSGKAVKRTARKARIGIKSLSINLLAPKHLTGSEESCPSICNLRVVEATECPQTVPEGEKPIHWRLLTTWPVETAEQAWEVIQAYRRRWDIEELFRLLKKQGFKVEKCRLEHPEKIIKMTAMAIKASLQARDLVAARKVEDERQASEMFKTDEVKLLTVLNKRMEGKTDEQKNPYPKETLIWCTWVIARLGGWMGYASQQPAGHQRMLRGLLKFRTIQEALELADEDP